MIKYSLKVAITLLTIAGRFRTLKYLARLWRSIAPVYFTAGQDSLSSVTCLHRKTQTALSSLVKNPLYEYRHHTTTDKKIYIDKQIHLVGEHFKLKIHLNTTNYSYIVDISVSIRDLHRRKKLVTASFSD